MYKSVFIKKLHVFLKLLKPTYFLSISFYHSFFFFRGTKAFDLYNFLYAEFCWLYIYGLYDNFFLFSKFPANWQLNPEVWSDSSPGREYNLGPVQIFYRTAISTVPRADKYYHILIIFFLIIITKSGLWLFVNSSISNHFWCTIPICTFLSMLLQNLFIFMFVFIYYILYNGQCNVLFTL